MNLRALRGLCPTLLVIATMTTSGAAQPFGINAHIPGPEVADRIAEAGIGWVRIDMIWALVEPEPDRFDWSIYDRTIAGLEGRGLRIFATLQGTPAWATDGDEFAGVPSDSGRWRRFCYRAAARYRGRVDAWGLWNEPNLSRFWQGSRSAYLYDILVAGIDAIEIADPDALVVGPDLAHLQSASWDSWLRSVISVAGSKLDVVSHHTYPSNDLASDVTRKLDSGSSYPWDPPPVREVLQSTGWWGRPVWLTETGVETAGSSERVQEKFVVDLLADWFGPARRHWWLDRVFFYEMHDDPNAGSSFGLVGPPPTLEPKLAYEAYRESIDAAEIDDAAVIAGTRALVVPSSGRMSFDIQWRNTGTTSWRSDDGYVAIGQVDQPGWIVTGGALPSERTVHPGSSVVLTFQLQSPPLDPERDPLQARFSARLQRSFSWPFGDEASVAVTQSEGSLPSATSTPRTVVVEAGMPASFSVDPDAEGVILRWFRDGAPLSESARVRGTFRSRLEISTSEPDDDGEYHCEVRNRVGPVIVYAGRLRVLPSVPGTASPPRVPSDRVTTTLERWRTWRLGATGDGLRERDDR